MKTKQADHVRFEVCECGKPDCRIVVLGLYSDTKEKPFAVASMPFEDWERLHVELAAYVALNRKWTDAEPDA